MKSGHPIRAPWKNRLQDTGSAEDRAGALLRRLPRRPLSAADKAQIAEHLSLVVAAAGAPRRRGWLVAAALAGVAAGIAAGAAVWRQKSVAPVASVEQLIAVPACAVARTSGEDYRAAFVGPASASVGRRSIVMREGRAEIAADARPVDIRMDGARVEVPAHGRAMIEVHEGGLRRVAAVRSEAVVEWTTGKTITVETGREWRPDGIADLRPEGAREAERFLESNEANACAPEPAPPSTEPPVQPEPHRAAPRPAATAPEPPPAVAPPPAPPAPPSAMREEADLLAEAMQRLRVDRDPAKALELLDRHDQQFADGGFGHEATVVRVEAWLMLGRRDRVLAVLDRAPLSGFARARELAALRGELRAADGRCAEAIKDFAQALSTGGDDEVAGRALFGSGACRATLGDRVGARADFERYLATFKDGPLAARVREALNGL